MFLTSNPRGAGMSAGALSKGLRALVLVAAALALGGIQSFSALFAPSADLWPRWKAENPASTETLDHSAWDQILAARTAPGADGIARFDYAGVTAEEREALDGYIASLSAQRVTQLKRDEQRALWFNLYNALTVRLILDHPEAETIQDIDISPGLFSGGPWDAPLVEIEGEEVTLNDIEHRILRPIWRDPRIHYGVNCASLGCPDLPSKAFTAENTDALLEAGARAFVNHPRGVSVDGGAIKVSSLYAWFVEDFGGDDAGILAHIRRYAAADLGAALDGIDTIDDHDYDWALNAP